MDNFASYREGFSIKYMPNGATEYSNKSNINYTNTLHLLHVHIKVICIRLRFQSHSIHILFGVFIELSIASESGIW